MMRAWISAARPQTLPLAMSCLISGSAMAFAYGAFSWPVLWWSLLTTLLLQVLSNFANDLGDSEKGVDNSKRIGPMRAVQSGIISKVQMRVAVIWTSIIALGSGLILLWTAFGAFNAYFFTFLLLGICAIASAIIYTMGKHAYGYRGLGDAFVLVFFGWTGVLGVFFLHTRVMEPLQWLPATAIGLLAAGVLNLNNLRDIDNDRASGKRTLAVKLGPRNTRMYHLVLLDTSFLCMWLYGYFSGMSWVYITLAGYLPLVFHLVFVFKSVESAGLIPALKQLALITFFISLLFALGHILHINAG
jgi:1,4-dihydroxy-2-naphthoate octaprenyltransferase